MNNERKKYIACWVEDDQQWAQTYIELLNDEYIAVDLFDNASAAIDALSQGVYHLLIIDHEIRGGTGLDVIKKIISTTRPSRPIILISGRIESLPDPKTIINEYLYNGALDYIKKTQLDSHFGIMMRNHIEQYYRE